MTKISIITPIYCDISQKIDWLDEMIQSVIPQTITDWELILIDDKSPLALDSLKFKYQNEPRLRWLENAENSGPAKTRNTAVGLATSECILPLDSDDMLASPEVLEAMYDAWLVNPSIIIYGDLQTYKRVNNSSKFQRDKRYQLGEYTFELAMNLEGIMPVTAMHSKECHIQSGGWKPILKEGLEDLEYWISAGEQGFCGQRIDTVTLVYRRQEESRAHKLKHDIDPKFRVMQNQIKQMHADVYAGRFPVACCGKQASAPINNPVVVSAQVSKGKVTTELADSYGQPVDEKHWIWKQYIGKSLGNKAKISRTTQIQYMVQGTNHTFPIHKKDEALFRGTVRDIFVNVPDPRNREPEPEPEIQIEIVAPTITEIPKPDMSTIVRMDSAALKVAEPVIQAIPPDFMEEDTFFGPTEEVIVEPNPPPFISDTISGHPFIVSDDRSLPSKGFSSPSLEEPKPLLFNISNLGLGEKLTALLDENGWTVELAAIAEPEQFTMLPGIGIKRATTIIEKAKELING